MRIFSRATLALLIIGIFATSVSATFIRLTTQMSTPPLVDGNSTQVKVEITNSGDEAANNVMLDLALPEGFSKSSHLMGTIPPNTKKNISFEIDIPQGADGSYPVLLNIQYTDEKGYLLTAVSNTLLRVKTLSPQKVNAKITELTLPEKGSRDLEIAIQNTEDTAIDLKIKIFLSDELVLQEPEKTIRIEPKALETIYYKVENFRGLQGSNYAGTLSLEYDKAGIHHTTLYRFGISIEETRRVPTTAILAVFLIMLLLLFKYKKGKKR